MVVGYRHLLREFLEINSREYLTLEEIARKMKLTRSEMKTFLEIMEINGDIKICSPGNANEGNSPQCMGCPLGCCQNVGACDRKIRAYKITEKGVRACAGIG